MLQVRHVPQVGQGLDYALTIGAVTTQPPPRVHGVGSGGS